jgi:hypothetical protein
VDLVIVSTYFRLLESLQLTFWFAWTYLWQDRIRKAQKEAADSNLQMALAGAVSFADKAVAQSEVYCVLRIDVGLDNKAVREAVTMVMDKHKVFKSSSFSTAICVSWVY